MSKTTEITDSINKHVFNGEIGNNDLVQIIELCADYLNPQTLSDYARNHKVSYNGVKKSRKESFKFGKVKFIIDNE